MQRDIAVIICSRGREHYLERLLREIEAGFVPALAAGGLSLSTFVYGQNYPEEFWCRLERLFAPALASGRLVLIRAARPHRRIGDVVAAAIAAVHERADYRLAMLIDDDSRYRADAASDENLRDAATTFLARGDLAYSIKLGTGRALEFWPFVDPAGPIMPFKEKMLWVARPVLEEALALPRFAELSIGEDAVIAALAWRAGPQGCLGVFGVAGFVHLGFEPDPEQEPGEIAGGYADLMEATPGAAEHGKYDAALRSGVTPYHVLPDIFVGEDHPHYIYNGIRPEAVARHMPDAGPFRRLSMLPADVPSQ